MAIKCNNCGGNMKYNIAGHNLVCEHCEHTTDIEKGAINRNTEQINEDEYGYDKVIDTALFQCPECGAEIRTFDDEATVFCSYCGKQSFLKESVQATKPSRIIPFLQDKDEVKKAYIAYLRKKLFVPKALKDPNCLSEMRGIYIPHWSLSYSVEGDFIFDGVRRYTRGNYDYRELYDVNAKIIGDVTDISFDASEAFSDSIAYEIAPYQTAQSQPFHEGYVAGFYMDKETVRDGEYDELGEQVFAKRIQEAVERGGEKRHGAKINIIELKNKPKMEKKASSLILLPVWFMTYRKNDRISYSVMNGQTGKMTMDLPVDKMSFFTFVAGLSILFSFVFWLLFTTVAGSISALNISSFSLMALLLSSYMLYSETKYIHKKDNNQRGYVEVKEKRFAKLAAKLKRLDGPTTTLFIIVFFSFIYVFANIANLAQGGGTRSTLASVIFGIVFIILHAVLLKKIKPYRIAREALCIACAILICFIFTCVYCLGSPNDAYYYVLSAIASAGIIFNALGCIRGFDYLTSRPVPNFYERKGADNNA